MTKTYTGFAKKRSLRFHLAYAAGFETMALSVGHWLVNDREYLFANSDSRVASMVLWHFVEEIEHKNSAFDVYQHVVGDYPTRIFGLLYASFHVMALSRRAYRSMLIRDGLWWNLRSRLQLWKEVGRFLRLVLPHMLVCCAPNHNPRDIADPAWVQRWQELYEELEGRAPLLDTHNLNGPPVFPS
jgi:predicted metal-dependent hydrolase